MPAYPNAKLQLGMQLHAIVLRNIWLDSFLFEHFPNGSRVLFFLYWHSHNFMKKISATSFAISLNIEIENAEGIGVYSVNKMTKIYCSGTAESASLLLLKGRR